MKLERQLFLIGFMGVGKTSTSRELAQMFEAEQIDTDALIEKREGRSVAQIFERYGEEFFRRKETELLDELAKSRPCIVSCGGGMAMRQENVEKMKRCGTVVYLKASPDTIYSHVKDSTDRPLLNGNMNVAYIKKLMDERAPKYQKACDIAVDTDGCTPRQAAERVVEQLKAQTAPARS